MNANYSFDYHNLVQVFVFVTSLVKKDRIFIFSFFNAGVAQLVEQLTCNQQVVGSSPIASSRFVICSGRTNGCG